MSKLTNIDLNLLKTLDALLEERSVSNAALNLYRTQSAVSHSLQKLREIFADPLLVREGREMVLTDKAQSLQAPLGKLLNDIELLVAGNKEFDPHTSKQQINIAAPDIFLWNLCGFIQYLKSIAPHLNITLYPEGNDGQSLQKCHIDILFSASTNQSTSSTRSLNCALLEWTVFAKSDHCINELTSIQQWADHEQIIPKLGGNDESHKVLNELMKTHNVRQLIEFNQESCWAMLPVLTHSNALLTTPAFLPKVTQSHFQLKSFPCPLPLESYVIKAYWLADREYQDTAIKWLVKQLHNYFIHD